MSKKPLVKRPPKTIKEKKFVKAYVETGNATTAVLEAGYDTDRKTARVIGSQNLAKLNLEGWFKQAGLTKETMAQNTTRIALTAKRIHGTGDDFIEVEDNQAQLKGMEFAAKLTGWLNTETNIQNNIVVTPIYGGLSNAKGDSPEMV